MDDPNSTLRLFGITVAGASLSDAFFGWNPADPMLLLQNGAVGALQTYLFKTYAIDGYLYFALKDKNASTNGAGDLAKGIGAAMVGISLIGGAARHLFFGMPLGQAMASTAVGSALVFAYMYPQMRADI